MAQKVEKKRRRINWREITAKASALILKQQRADYVWLRAALGGIGTGTASTLLKKLEAKGIVRRGKQRHWMVIVNEDGTPKSEVPEKRRFKKPRRFRNAIVREPKTFVTTPTVEKLHKAPAHTVTTAEKQTLVRSQAEHAEGRSKEILLAILDDVATSRESTSILGLLKSKV